MKYLIYFISICFLTFSCQNNPVVEGQESTTQNSIQIFGDSNISKEGALNGISLLAALDTIDSLDVSLTATVVSVCQKKGCWMDVQLNDSTEMLVRFKDYGFFVPMDCAGKTATIKGLAKKVTHSVEWLQHKAEDAGKKPDEIALITEPEIAYSIPAATAVIID